MESKALVKSTNNIVASRFFAHTLSRIRRIVKICEVVDLFLRKPFWFFLSMLSILGSMHHMDGDITHRKKARCRRMLWAILNKSWKKHPMKQEFYGHLPLISKTIQVRRTRNAEHFWRSKDELISDVLLWTPTYGRASAGRPAGTNLHQLSEDTGCSTENVSGAMDDRDGKSRKSMQAARLNYDIYTYIYIYLFIYIYIYIYIYWNKRYFDTFFIEINTFKCSSYLDI